MKISTFIAYLLPALVLAVPPPADQGESPKEKAKIKEEAHNKSLMEEYEKKGYKDCGTDLHYPALDGFKRGAAIACGFMYPGAKDRVAYGFRRAVVNLRVFDWPTTRPASYEVWTKEVEQPGGGKAPEIDKDICTKWMTGDFSGKKVDGLRPCTTKTKEGKPVVLVRSWMVMRNQNDVTVNLVMNLFEKGEDGRGAVTSFMGGHVL